MNVATRSPHHLGTCRLSTSDLMPGLSGLFYYVPHQNYWRRIYRFLQEQSSFDKILHVLDRTKDDGDV